MPETLYPPSRTQTIAQVLDAAFGILRASLVKCLWYGPVSIIAGQLANIYHLAIGRALEPFGGGDPVWRVLYVAGALGTIVVSAALCVRQRDIVLRRPAGTAAAFSEAIRRLPSLVLIVVAIAVAVSAGPLVASALLGLETFAGMTVTGTLILAACVSSSVYLATALSMAWPAVLFEGRGPANALRYSFVLVWGNWWRTAVVFAVALVIVLVLYFVMGAAVLPFAGAMDIAMVTAVSEVLLVALGSAVAPFFAAIVLALYGDLRARKEGVDLEQRLAAASPH